MVIETEDLFFAFATTDRQAAFKNMLYALIEVPFSFEQEGFEGKLDKYLSNISCMLFENSNSTITPFSYPHNG